MWELTLHSLAYHLMESVQFRVSSVKMEVSGQIFSVNQDVLSHKYVILNNIRDSVGNYLKGNRTPLVLDGFG